MWGWVIGIIIFLSIVSGGCGSCGSSCNSCKSCGSSSSNSSCSSCGDCGDDDDYYDDDYWYEDYSDYKKRYGKITFRIHTVDGEELEISGSRKLSDSDSILAKDSEGNIWLKGYSPKYQLGKKAVLYLDGGDRLYSQTSGFNSSYDYRYLYIHDNRSTVDVYEKLVDKSYRVVYVANVGTNNIEREVTYKAGDDMMTEELQNFMTDVNNKRYQVTGFKTESQVDWSHNGKFGEIHDSIHSGDSKLYVYATLVADTVKVRLHYNYEGLYDEVRSIPFNYDINKLWTLEKSNLEFVGWSTSEDVFTPHNATTISKDHRNVPLDLYAYYKLFKTIKVIDSEGYVQSIKVYDNNTLSISTPSGVIGIKLEENGTYIGLGNIYKSVKNGETYYFHYNTTNE